MVFCVSWSSSRLWSDVNGRHWLRTGISGLVINPSTLYNLKKKGSLLLLKGQNVKVLVKVTGAMFLGADGKLNDVTSRT